MKKDLLLVVAMIMVLNTILAAGAQSDAAKPEVLTVASNIKPLPGRLNGILMFNSNSPEVVQSEGILLSTYSPEGMKTPTAHLNFRLRGRFNIFAHHIAKPAAAGDLRTLYLAILLHNPAKTTARVRILSGASYLSQPDAPFIPLPPILENPRGDVFSGPGDRASDEVLRGNRDKLFPSSLSIPAGKTVLLMNQPIPVKTLSPPLNGRSTLIELYSSGPLNAASLAMYARQSADGSESAPAVSDWVDLLRNGQLAGPRDKTPTARGAKSVIYGRVAGVQEGTVWHATLEDKARSRRFTIPSPGKSVSFPISSVEKGTHGTAQIQSAPLKVRYPDTAFEAHGNYAVKYELEIPLHNPFPKPHSISIHFQTPLKKDDNSAAYTVNSPPPTRVHFRGTLRLAYRDDAGTKQVRYLHLVQQQGDPGSEVVRVRLLPKAVRTVNIQFIYPPDATPPQMVTIRNDEPHSSGDTSSNP